MTLFFGNLVSNKTVNSRATYSCWLKVWVLLYGLKIDPIFRKGLAGVAQGGLGSQQFAAQIAFQTCGFRMSYLTSNLGKKLLKIALLKDVRIYNQRSVCLRLALC